MFTCTKHTVQVKESKSAMKNPAASYEVSAFGEEAA